MKQLKINEEKALELYPNSSKEFKQILEDTFGVKFFKPKCITHKIKTFEDALFMLNKVDSIPSFPMGLNKRELATRKLEIICKALNENWKLDWSNWNQNKYYPVLRKENSGWSFDCSSYFCADALRSSGLYLKSEKLSNYCGKQFKDLWIDYIEG